MAKPKSPIDEHVPDPALIDERGPTTEWGRRKSYTLSDTGTYAAIPPIQRAVARRTLTPRQGRAAEKLYRHWYLSGLAGTCGSADPLKIFGTGMDASRLCSTEAAVAHYEAFKRALAEVEQRANDNGSRADHARKTLIGVVCEERNIGEMGEIIGFRGTAAETMAKTILRSALNVLIKRWNL